MERRASATANPLSGRDVIAGSSVAEPSAAELIGTADAIPVDADRPSAAGGRTAPATRAETRVAGLSWTGRRVLLVTLDVIAWAAGLTLAAVLRQDFDVSAVDLYGLAPVIAVAVTAQVVVGGVREAYCGRHSARLPARFTTKARTPTIRTTTETLAASSRLPALCRPQ